MASSSNQTHEYGSLSFSQRLLQKNQHGRELSDGSAFSSGASSASSSSYASSSTDTTFTGSITPPTAGSNTHIPLLHFLCQSFPTSKDIIQSTLMQDVTEARRPATLPAVTNNDVSTTTAGGTNVGGRFRVNVSISADTVAKLLHVSDSQVVRLLRGINYTKSNQRSRSKHHLSPKPRIKQAAKAKKNHKTMMAGKLDFEYPINIAINNGATSDVVEVLARAAPGILLKPEESSGHNSLFIALHKQPQNHALIQVLLQCTPQLAFGKDQRGNTPLHWAIQRGYYCSLPVIQALYQANPKAVLQANYNGETPYQIAQRSALVKEDVVDFLQLCHDENAHCAFDDNDDDDIFVIATKKKATIALYDLDDVHALPVEENWLEDLF